MVRLLLQPPWVHVDLSSFQLDSHAFFPSMDRKYIKKKRSKSQVNKIYNIQRALQKPACLPACTNILTYSTRMQRTAVGILPPGDREGQSVSVHTIDGRSLRGQAAPPSTKYRLQHTNSSLRFFK